MRRNFDGTLRAMAASPADKDRSFCWEPVGRVRPSLMISLGYVHPAQSEQILALHAWLAAIEEAVSGPSDEHVARAKLAWWRGETLDHEPGLGAHPIMRYLQRSGCLERLPPERLEEELRLAASRIDRSVIPGVEALKEVCQRIGENQLELEMAIAPCILPDEETTQACGRLNGLVQLMREGVRSSSLGLWWLPLDLSARHGVLRSERPDAESRDGVRTMVQSICAEGLSWQPDWRSISVRPMRTNGGHDRRALSRHWLLYSRLQARQLDRFHRRVASSGAFVFDTAPAGDALTTWRLARRLGDSR